MRSPLIESQDWAVLSKIGVLLLEERKQMLSRQNPYITQSPRQKWSWCALFDTLIL